MVTTRHMENLKYNPLGNTAMHMPQAPGLPLPAMMGAIPGVTRFATSMMRRQIAELDVPPVKEFLELLVDMGAHLWVCRMSFDMMKLNEADLFEGVEPGPPGGAETVGWSGVPLQRTVSARSRSGRGREPRSGAHPDPHPRSASARMRRASSWGSKRTTSIACSPPESSAYM